MPRIAHISDIHFGRTFDFSVWRKVRAKIKAFNPNIIIASGDFTDDPHPFLLLAAKRELEKLSAECPLRPQFFAVPGNHDVLDAGNVWRPGAACWFDRIMFCDTTAFDPRNSIWWNTRGSQCDRRMQSCARRKINMKWPTENECNETVVTCLNSNPFSLRAFAFATGEVGAAQVTGLEGSAPSPNQQICSQCTTPGAVPARKPAIALRVAVLHHHPLPIAVPSKSIRERGGEAQLEPFLVLRNSGDFLHKLQQQRFDLVLHGHKHRPQFARIELQTKNVDRYPLLVLAGGSTAKDDEDSTDNTLRLICTRPNGRFVVDTYEEGVLNSRLHYKESLEDYRRRAFTRAAERAGMFATELRSTVTIDGVGHLRSQDETIDLQVPAGGETVDGLAINVLIPPHDTRVNIKLLNDGNGVASIEWRDTNANTYDITQEAPQHAYCWLHFTEPLEGKSTETRSFTITEAAANSIAMTRWELAERSRGKQALVDPNYEQIGYFVTYPVEKLVIRLVTPRELDGVTPEVRCLRHPDYPAYPLNFRAEDRAFGYTIDKCPVDPELQGEAQEALHFRAADRSWSFTIERPIPGHMYNIRWKVPDLIANGLARRRTAAFQKLLLQLARAVEVGFKSGFLSDLPRQCCNYFAQLLDALSQRFCSEINPSEQLASFLMSYDSSHLRLQPVLAQPDSLLEGDYAVPLGGGVAGAAFLQRRVMTWGADPESDSLIKPIPAGLPAHHILALPIYHWRKDAAGNIQLDTDPGAVIAVVTLGSDVVDSRIAECHGDDPAAKSLCQEAQALAQLWVIRILDLLARPSSQQGVRTSL
jgi:predicted MPP superfamily phosphohydrolase